MAEDNTESDEIILHCACCGIKEDDDIKLKRCTACYLVRYCGVKCQREHRPQHKEECNKRAAELRDEILFKQPDESSYPGDCPICCLPLSLDEQKSSMMMCCCKLICNGCMYANQKREFESLRLEEKCPFCRHPMPKSREEQKMLLMKRVEANDPAAMTQIGSAFCQIEGDNKKAFEYLTKAARLGDPLAHYNLSIMYSAVGHGGDKYEKKVLYHSEEAAIGGHTEARHDLGCDEMRRGRLDRAVKHWTIAANKGHDESLEALKKCSMLGKVSKDDFASVLRAHKAAVDATKNPQRAEGEAFYRNSN